jgi:hypothetical protein
MRGFEGAGNDMVALSTWITHVLLKLAKLFKTCAHSESRRTKVEQPLSLYTAATAFQVSSLHSASTPCNNLVDSAPHTCSMDAGSAVVLKGSSVLLRNSML